MTIRFRSVLCPVDFSDVSRTALHAAVQVTREFKARLHVLFVEDPLLSAAAVMAPAAPGLKDELAQFVAGTPDLDPSVQAELHVTAGRPAGEILRFAEHEHIDAIVIGAHGLSGIRKAFFGSTTARVLKRSTIPLMVVPASAVADKGHNLAGLGAILVLTDFGLAATCAARAAASLAAGVGARLVLVHVLKPMSVPASWASRAAAALTRREDEAHRQMCCAMAPLEKYGPVESVIVRGNVAGSVAALVATRHSGLVVMGLDTDASESRPGSTAYAVIASAPVPVLVVPAMQAAIAASAPP
jgi:nucleotide-binding universal stress UspA family protein